MKTIDGGVFPEPLNKPRVLASIEQKLQVIELYKELQKEREQAEEELKEPAPKGVTRKTLNEFYEKRRKLRNTIRKGVERQCRKAFPEIVRTAVVGRWVRRSEVEAWDQLPPSVRGKATATPNLWRRKVGAKVKGRKKGGSIPHVLQKELDTLIMEMANGLSDVSERKEIVDTESLAPRYNVRHANKHVRASSTNLPTT